MKPDKKSSGLGGLFIVQLYQDMEKIYICGIDLIAGIEDGLNLEGRRSTPVVSLKSHEESSM